MTVRYTLSIGRNSIRTGSRTGTNIGRHMSVRTDVGLRWLATMTDV